MSIWKKLFGSGSKPPAPATPQPAMPVQFMDFRSQTELQIDQEAKEGKSLGPEVDALVRELIEIGRSCGFTHHIKETQRLEMDSKEWDSMIAKHKRDFDEKGHHKRGREIAEILYTKGGQELMIAAHYRVVYAGLSGTSLSWCWNGAHWMA